MNNRILLLGTACATAILLVAATPASAGQSQSLQLAQSGDPITDAIQGGSGESRGGGEESGGDSEGSTITDLDGNPIGTQPENPDQSGTAPQTNTGNTPNGGSDVDAGSASNSESTTKVIYHKDANGKTVSVTYVTYDKDGKEIDRQDYPVNDDSGDDSGNQDSNAGDDDGGDDGQSVIPPVDDEGDDYTDPSPVADGTFKGSFGGDAAGEIRFTVQGDVISGFMKGRYSNAPFRVDFSGTVDSNGKFTASASGSTHTTINNQEGDYPVWGTVSGDVTTRQGTWSGKEATMMSDADGYWSVSKYP